ncbi:MAG: aminodeoxychorismate/anthranilate synthase component II [Bacteroidota bacterium]|nr:aminodeoxychorismate/anthranilate synthase component II [Bacteroidota bacterium]
MNIVLIDNYDSFTYNLVHYLKEINGVNLVILKNDQLSSNELEGAEKIVISPGPGLPSGNGRIIELVREYSGVKPIFGVCLGLQTIYEAFGGQLLNLKRVFHGVTSNVSIVKEDPILKGMPNPFLAGRYHSWVCDPKYLPTDLMITAWDENNEIMACRHVTHPTFGVQFHPESFLTPEGKRMIENFVNC